MIKMIRVEEKKNKILRELTIFIPDIANIIAKYTDYEKTYSIPEEYSIKYKNDYFMIISEMNKLIKVYSFITDSFINSYEILGRDLDYFHVVDETNYENIVKILDIVYYDFKNNSFIKNIEFIESVYFDVDEEEKVLTFFNGKEEILKCEFPYIEGRMTVDIFQRNRTFNKNFTKFINFVYHPNDDESNDNELKCYFINIDLVTKRIICKEYDDIMSFDWIDNERYIIYDKKELFVYKNDVLLFNKAHNYTSIVILENGSLMAVFVRNKQVWLVAFSNTFQEKFVFIGKYKGMFYVNVCGNILHIQNQNCIYVFDFKHNKRYTYYCLLDPYNLPIKNVTKNYVSISHGNELCVYPMGMGYNIKCIQYYDSIKSKN